MTESTTVQQLKERLMLLDPLYLRGLLSIKTAAAQGIPTDASFLGETIPSPRRMRDPAAAGVS
ncbi:hypothetical protein DIPPA_26063 [Diplonema papillatum]|nr:hypothetical protein DIPPA_26063 [Diplonema papillatum]